MAAKVAITHSRIRLGAKRTNSKRLHQLIAKLITTHGDVDAIVLPPYPFTGPVIGYYSYNKVRHKLREAAERISSRRGGIMGISANQLVKWSKEANAYIIGGPIVERAGPNLYLSMLVSSPDGSIFYKYRKIGLTPDDVEHGIRYGKEVGVLTLKPSGIKIGLFIDEDLAYPEIFRGMQIHGVNIVIGVMAPYNSPHFGPVRSSNGIITMNTSVIKEFLSVRSREVGVPFILVGSVIEGNNYSGTNINIAYLDTITVEPDIGVLDDSIFSIEDDTSYFIVEVDPRSSRSRALIEPIETFMINSCKKLK